MYVILLMAYGRLADCMPCAKVQWNGAWVVCEYTSIAVHFCIQSPLMHGTIHLLSQKLIEERSQEESREHTLSLMTVT